MANDPRANFDALKSWAISDCGSAFRSEMLDRLDEELSPEEFMLTIYALLSYYRALNWLQVIPPADDCDIFLSGPGNLDGIDNYELKGRLMERVAFSVTTIATALRPALFIVRYLRPYQLANCMVHNMSTSRLNVYCSARLSRSCSHRDAVHCMNQTFGFGTGI